MGKHELSWLGVSGCPFVQAVPKLPNNANQEVRASDRVDEKESPTKRLGFSYDIAGTSTRKSGFWWRKLEERPFNLGWHHFWKQTCTSITLVRCASTGSFRGSKNKLSCFCSLTTGDLPCWLFSGGQNPSFHLMCI